MSKEKFKTSISEFVRVYQDYLRNPSLKGISSEERSVLSSILTMENEAISFHEISAEKAQIVRNTPVIQVSRFQFRFDRMLGRFFTQSFSNDVCFWGIEFRFPQLFLDQNSKIIKTLRSGTPNALLWKTLHQWIRDWTQPARFVMENQIVRSAPFRLGNEAGKLGQDMLAAQNVSLKLYTK